MSFGKGSLYREPLPYSHATLAGAAASTKEGHSKE